MAREVEDIEDRKQKEEESREGCGRIAVSRDGVTCKLVGAAEVSGHGAADSTTLTSLGMECR